MTIETIRSLENGTKVIGNGRTMTVSKLVVPKFHTGFAMEPESTLISITDDATGQRISFDPDTDARASKIAAGVEEVR